MVEYRIPIAGVVAAAVMIVSFLFAVIVINGQDSGRFRTVGVLGVVLLGASTVLDSVNGSLGGSYGQDSVIFGVGSVVVALSAAVGLVLLALAVVWARQPTRRRGGH